MHECRRGIHVKHNRHTANKREVSIGSVILRTRPLVDRVIVVDDGSTDRTSEVARLVGAEVIRHKTNMGKGAALKTGFEALHDIQSEAYLHLTGGEGLKNGSQQQNGQEVIMIINIDG